MVERCVRDAEVASSNLVASIVTRSVGQAVKTPPSHGGNRGSIPLRTARKERRKLFFFISGTGTENRPDHIYHAPPAQTGSGIEVVITGLTRNQFAGNRTGVRIPPAAREKQAPQLFPAGVPCFYVQILNRPVVCICFQSSLQSSLSYPQAAMIRRTKKAGWLFCSKGM